MHRVLVGPEQVSGATIVVSDPRELHHMRHVLRLGVGDAVTCFDGQGGGYVGTIAEVTSDALRIAVRERLAPEQLALSVCLLPALIKGERFEWLIQKATELGVDRVTPLVTHHTVVKAASAGKAERWRRIAQEAAKQCGRLRVPRLDAPRPFGEAIEELSTAAHAVMPTLAVTTVPLRNIVQQVMDRGGRPADRPMAVLIGPEGDFSPEEVALAERFGARPVSLGPLTLRSETAAVAVISMLQYAFDQS